MSVRNNTIQVTFDTLGTCDLSYRALRDFATSEAVQCNVRFAVSCMSVNSTAIHVTFAVLGTCDLLYRALRDFSTSEAVRVPWGGCSYRAAPIVANWVHNLSWWAAGNIQYMS